MDHSSDENRLWRECLRWIIDCGIIDKNHRVADANSDIVEFAMILRDGVILCLLCNRLHNNSIDIKELQQRPQMAQFLCCKNICEFLKACQNTFELKSEDLFDPWDLYRLDDFGKVLRTLSKLSSSQKAKSTNIRGFPVHSLTSSSHASISDDCSNDVIYRNLLDDVDTEVADSINTDDVYGTNNINCDDISNDRIYDTIICQQLNDRCEITNIENDVSALIWANFQPRTRREHCIKELYDTESNYVEKALNMIINTFYLPLENVLSVEDHKIIFMNILELARIHQSFRDRLRQAVFYSLDLETPSDTGDNMLNIGDVFLAWKEKFVSYGQYCSKLSDSRSRLCQLEKSDLFISQRIIECGLQANRNQFHLQDLLSIPMQRVLKYHVLLSELIKLTSVESTDRLSLEEAKEAMQDINNYVNEMKRDYEMKQLIAAIVKSISDLELPDGMHLIDCGRLVKDGEIKLCDSSKDGNKLKNRYVFVFDRIMVVCKSLRGNQYSYKGAHVLRDYRVEVETDNNNGNAKHSGTLSKKFVTNGGYSFSLIQNRNANDCESIVLSVYCKASAQRDSWVHSLELAQDCDMPKNVENSGHILLYQSYDKATICSHCQKLLVGLFFQGYYCTVCRKNFHRNCIIMNKCYGSNNPIQSKNSFMFRRRRSHSTIQPSEVVICVQRFRSSDSRFLCFDQNDLIEIIHPNPNRTFMGRLVSSPDKVGIVHPEFVRKFNRISSSSSLCSSLMGQFSSSILNKDSEDRSFPSASDSRDSFFFLRSNSSASRRPSLPCENFASASIEHSISQEYVNTGVFGQQWYQGSLERRESETRLRGTPNGTFLVRFSNTQQKYVVSISFNGDVKHTKIERTIDNRFYLDESNTFASIVELVNYYHEHNLRESFETLDTTLRQAYVAYRPYIAIHNFEATNPNFLELVVGQHVDVISRIGEDRGWWKGKSGNRIGYFPLSYVAPVE